MRVLGVDPGLAATGYAVVAGRRDGFSVLTAGTIRTKPDTPLPERLGEIHDRLQAALAAFDPHGVAVEEVFLARNAPSAMGTAEVIGIVKLLARGRFLRAYPPGVVKKRICGNGSAPKEQMLAMVRALVGGKGAEGWSDHAGDAVALALCALFEGDL
ncbi:MAG: crossover junction endodeoxyribonuclease RuvC [Candidatus Bipolaricaulota bacterium]|nr:crossover junction endodeoxyribonuclease RuvC [Candidatus Bipolaricaulota bacterium]